MKFIRRSILGDEPRSGPNVSARDDERSATAASYRKYPDGLVQRAMRRRHHPVETRARWQSRRVSRGPIAEAPRGGACFT